MNNMSDIAVKPASNQVSASGEITPFKLPDYKPMRLTPTFLVSFEKVKKGEPEYFIATKYDDSFAHCAKFIGFFYSGFIDTIISNYGEIIDSMSATNFVEILFPWNRISSIRSLVYRHKTIGERK